MFTGIVEEAGSIKAITPRANAIRLAIQSRVCAKTTKKGYSLAVNGCCLTVVGVRRQRKGSILEFDLLEETWRKTNLQFLGVGRLVNLERPLRAGSEFGGHFVTGHVDGLGRITRWEQQGRDWVLDVAIPPELMRYAVYKGSIAIDGISLTIAEVLSEGVRIWIIPHTYKVTALRDRKPGEFVNVEMDIIGKYVEKFVSSYAVSHALSGGNHV